MEMGPKELVIKQEIKEEDEVCFELIEDQSDSLEYVKEESVLNEIEQVDSCVDSIDSESCFVVDGIKEEIEVKHEDLDVTQINNNMEFKEEEINCEWSESTLNERDPLDLSEMKDTSMLPHYESAQSSSSYNTDDLDMVRLKVPDSEGNEYQTTSSPYYNNDPMGHHSVCVKTSQPTTTRVVVKKFKCSECDYSSARSNNLKKHKMIHSGEKPFKCEECDYSCIRLGYLKEHKMTHTGQKPFKCDECIFSCIKSSDLKRHKMVHTGDKPLKCTECDYSCIRLKQLKIHKMNHAGEKSFKLKVAIMEMDPKELVVKQEIKEEDEVCFELIEDQSYSPECVKEESVLNEIEQLDSCVDFIDSQSCFVVDGIKEDLDDIQINENIEFKEEELNCEWSESTLNERDPLDISEMKDTSMLPHYELAQSSSSFNTIDSDMIRLKAPDSEGNENHRTSSPYYNNDPMVQHSLCVKTSQPTTTRVVVKKFKCSECVYSSTKSSHLKDHALRHTGEKPFKCEECDYSCITSGNLKVHKLIHTGEKPLKCEECDYSCTMSGNLKRHKMRHSGETPLKCEECYYSCIKSSELKRHKMIHSGEKPFKCDECNYSCIESSQLKRHKMRHSGEKPFKCDECNYSCILSSQLKKHKMRHSGEKPLKCEECNYSCILSSQLKAHKMRHTRENLFKCT